MNNNRGNNRRRGRSNRSQGGGQQHLNRIDSRARGNAPQLLDKYKKLAEEAHRNGDRVQAEYYLQFADHYFRVIADTKARQDEQRQRRDDTRSDRDWDDGDDNDQAETASEGSEERARDPVEENPFTRGNRQRRARRTPREDRGTSASEEAETGLDNDGGLDPSALPPAISEASPEAEEKPKRTRRPRKPKSEPEASDEAVQHAVNG